MVSTFTPNVQLEEPARGDDVGTWDTPVNSNMTLIDLIAGGIATISAAAGSVVLSAAQFKSNNITFNSTLIASITVTFPTSFIKPYTVGHVATGSTAYTITLGTTATGGQVIALPPGEFIDVFNDGTNLKFRNLGRVGQYWDYGGSSVPAWVSGCTVPPYLNCDGTTFSSGTYPQLYAVLGSTTLPDSRGRTRAILNQGTGRMTSAGGGVDGNTLSAAGGTETITLAAAQIPAISAAGANTITVYPLANSAYNFPITTGQWSVAATGGSGFYSVAWPESGGANASLTYTNYCQATNTISVVSNNTGGGAHINVQPTYIGGLTLIRAA